MNENKKIHIHIDKKQRSWLIVLGSIFLFLVILQTTFFYFSEPILKSYIQKKVYEKSMHIYELNFDDIRINLLKRSFVLTNFHLIPDTTLYKKLCDQKQYDKTIFDLQVDTFQIKKVEIYNLLKNKRDLNVKGVFMVSPKIKIIGQDNKKKKKQEKTLPESYTMIKDELLPQMFKYLFSFKVERIELKNGIFGFLKHNKNQNNKETFTASNISVIFNDFYIDRENFSENDLFTENIEIKIADYSLNLKDKIHTIKSKNLYVSTKEKTIKLNDIKLIHRNRAGLHKLDENIFNVSISEIVLNNSDFSQVYFDKKLNLRSAKISEIDINFYKQKQGKKVKFNKDSISQKIDLYKLLKGNIDLIGIDTIYLKSGHFKLYNNLKDKHATTSVRDIDIALFNFEVDSLSSLNTNKILYSDNIYMNMRGFDMKMKDAIHSLTVEQLLVHTKKNVITARHILLSPNNDFNYFGKQKKKGSNKISIPGVKIKDVDIHKYVNFNLLEIGNFEIENPEIDIIKVGEEVKKNKSKSDFSELIKNYLSGVVIDNIILNEGSFSYENKTPTKRTTTSGKIDFTLNNFSFNPNNIDLTKFFFADNLQIFFTDYHYKVDGNIHELNVDTLEISTFKSAITVKGFSFKPSDDENYLSILRNNNKSVTINFKIPQLVINENNIHKAIINNKLNISAIDIFSPNLKITSFPNIKAKKIKHEYVDSVKHNAILDLKLKIAENEVYVYENFNNFDGNNFYKLEEKKTIIDNIYKFTILNIDKLFVKVKNINLNDTCFLPIENIKNIAIHNINLISKDSLSLQQIDSIEYTSMRQITAIRKNVESPNFNKEEIFANIGNYMNVIDIDSFNIYNGNFSFLQQQDNKLKEVFKNNLSLKLIDFYFNYDSLEQTSNRFFFSKDIEISLKNYKFNLKDDVHSIVAKEVKLSTSNSKIEFKNIILSPDSSKIGDKKIPVLMYAFIPQTVIKDFDLMKFYNNQKLDISKFSLKNPRISIVLQSKKTKQDSLKVKRKIAEILLPKDIKEIFIGKFKIDSGIIHVARKNQISENTFFKTNFNISLSNFKIDSVSKFNNNPFFIPVENIELKLSDFNFKLPDSLHNVSIDKLNVSTKNKKLILSKLQISHNLTNRKYEILEQLKKSTLLSIKIPEIQIDGIEFDKVKINKELIVSNIFMKKPIFEIENFKTLLKAPTKEKKKFHLDDLDLYKMISKNLTKIAISNLEVNNISLNLKTHKKSKTDTFDIKKLSLNVKNLLIDSTAKKTKFLYSDDITINLRDYALPVEKMYSNMKVKNISISTGRNRIILDTLSLKPTCSYDEYMQKIKKETTILDIDAKRLEISKIDLEELINNQKVIAQFVIIDNLILKTYKDLNVEHDYNNKKARLIDKIVGDAVPYIKIDMIKIKDSYISYEQLSAKAKKTGLIFVSDVNGTITNLTNDSILLRSDLKTKISAKSELMGNGKLSLDITYFLNSVNKYYTIEGSLVNTDLTLLNTFLSDAMSVEIENGIIDSLEFKFQGTDSIAKGSVKMKYKNLEAYYLKKKKKNNIRERYELLTVIANLLLIRNNNPRMGFFVKGRIGYFHDWSYGEVKFWIMSVLSGVRSTITYEGADTRKIYRQSRRKIRQQKREDKKRLKKLKKIAE